MRAALNEIKQTEAYLQGELPPEEALVYEAKLLTSPLLRLNLLFQKKVYTIVKLYHRKKLKEEAGAVERQLFSDPAKADFRNRINRIFY